MKSNEHREEEMSDRREAYRRRTALRVAATCASFLLAIGAAAATGACGAPAESDAGARVADAASEATASGAAAAAQTTHAAVGQLPDEVVERARQYMGYYESIELTPEQQEVKRAALGEMPAPCCSDFSAYTCCCECNLSRTIWGLSNHLIAERGHDAAQVRDAVEEWVATINPDGYSGQVCTTGGCGRAFQHDGCGGMLAGQLVTG